VAAIEHSRPSGLQRLNESSELLAITGLHDSLVKTNLMTFAFFTVLLTIWPSHAVQANVDRETTAWRVEHQDLRLYAFLMQSTPNCSPS
jgi:hypothetical protein